MPLRLVKAPSQEPSDGELVRRAQGGDRSCFERLVGRHARKIHSLLLRMLRGNREEAEDLTQETLLSAYKGLAQFRSESGFATWLHRIAVNKALNHLDKKKLPVRPLVVEDDDGPRPLELPDPDHGPEELFQQLEAESVLQQALDRLSDNLRAVFLLREFQKLSHEEIGDALGCKPETVRVRLHRARKELLGLLKPYLEAR